MWEETSCSDEKWQIRSKQIYFCFELYVRQWTLHRCVYGCMSGNSTDFISKYGRLQRIILLKWRGKRTSQTEKCFEGTCIIFLRVTGGKTLRQPSCFPVAIYWLKNFRVNSDWFPVIVYTWTGNDLWLIEVHFNGGRKKIFVQNNKAPTVLVLFSLRVSYFYG